MIVIADVYFHNISSSNSAKPLPLSFRIKDERKLREHQARQEMLLAKRDRDLKHGGHSLVLHHAGERWTLWMQQPKERGCWDKRRGELAQQVRHALCTAYPRLLQHLWGGGGSGWWGRGRRAESGTRQVEGDVVLVAADNSKKVHPESVQSAGVLRCVKFVGDLFNTSVCERFGVKDVDI